MTGIGMVNILQAWKLLEWSVLLSAMVNEVVEAYDDHYSYELNIVKLHRRQNVIAGLMRDILKESGMVQRRSDHLYDPGNIEQEVFEDKEQEYYSHRCVTQVLGPIYVTINQAGKIEKDEPKSVNHKPLID